MKLHPAGAFKGGDVLGHEDQAWSPVKIVLEVKPWGDVTHSAAADMLLDFTGPAVTITTRPVTGAERVEAARLFGAGLPVCLAPQTTP